MTKQSDILRNNEVTILQLIDLLDAINDQIFQQPLEIFNGSSIGMHTRHIVEFYTCILNQKHSGVISYDKRDRNLLLESSTKYAKETLLKVIDLFQKTDLNTPIHLASNCSISSDVENDIIPTNLKRELLYAMDHNIHHLALIKIGIQYNFPTIQLDPNFGVAPSTIRHKQTISACAQ